MKLLATALIALCLASPALAADCPGNRSNAAVIFSRVSDKGLMAFKINEAKTNDVRKALSQTYQIPFEDGKLYIINVGTQTFGMLLVKSDGCTDERLPLVIAPVDLFALFNLAGVKAEDVTPYVDGISM